MSVFSSTKGRHVMFIAQFDTHQQLLLPPTSVAHGVPPEDAACAMGFASGTWREITDAEAAELMKPSLARSKAAKLLAVDADTSAAITAGFEFTHGGQKLRFSYDHIDQQNFADTANAATLALMNVPGVPPSVTWNGWKEDGKLVRLTMTANEFLNLYMAGALAHKAACMERGGLRKAAVEAAMTHEDIENA